MRAQMRAERKVKFADDKQNEENKNFRPILGQAEMEEILKLFD